LDIRRLIVHLFLSEVFVTFLDKTERETACRAGLSEHGTDNRIFEFLGAHPESRADVSGTVFRVWAEGARSVSVVGDFNAWNREKNPMTRTEGGIWETFVPDINEFDA
jgi:1,4-alpha-glucan branching enzyme